MTVGIPQITRATADHFGLTLQDLHGPSRHRKVAWPRIIAMALARERGATLKQIGSYFCRDHTTVLNAVRRLNELCANDRYFLDDVDAVRLRLQGEKNWRARFQEEMTAAGAIAEALRETIGLHGTFNHALWLAELRAAYWIGAACLVLGDLGYVQVANVI